jgi:hypothetical protein
MVVSYRIFGTTFRFHFQANGYPETSVKIIILPCVKFRKTSSCIWESGVPPRCRHSCRAEVCVTRPFVDMCKLLELSEWCRVGEEQDPLKGTEYVITFHDYRLGVCVCVCVCVSEWVSESHRCSRGYWFPIFKGKLHFCVTHASVYMVTNFNIYR